MARKALGRGLSALLSDSFSNSTAPSLEQGDELMELDIDLIESNPNQPRTRFDEDKLNELAQSIKANGVVQPILLRKMPSGRYQIVAGERRWRASQRAGLHKITAVIRDIPDSKLLELALIENIQRAELNPVEEAHAYRRLIQELNITQDEVAQRVGKDRSSISNYLRLLKLPKDIQAMLENGTLTMGHARALLALYKEENKDGSGTEKDVSDLVRKLAQEAVLQKLSVRQVEQAVRRISYGPKNTLGSTLLKNDANIRAAEVKLKRHLSTQVRIHLSQSGGKIEIDFSSMSELDRIYSVITKKSEE